MFPDRVHAAFMLAKKLKEIKVGHGIVLAIPRGGVPIGSVIARELEIPLDLAMSKKIGHPMNAELAIGSLTLNDLVLDPIAEKLPKAYISTEVKKLRVNLEKRYNQFTKGRKPYNLKGKDVIVVDDGLATGNTMLACIDDIRKQGANSIIVAVPVSSRSAAAKIQDQIDHFVCLEIPSNFFAVGDFYQDFSEVPDALVVDLLKENTNRQIAGRHYTF